MVSRYRLLRFLGGPPPDMVSLTRDETSGAAMVLHMLPEALGAERPASLGDLETTLEFLSEDPIPGIPQVGGWELNGDTPGFTEQFVGGQPLMDLIVRAHGQGQKIPHAAAAVILRRLAFVLEGAHELDLFHGDLQPNKVMVDKKDVHVLGYPWCRYRPFPFEKSPPSTLAHLPPEALDGARPDARWDLYQLGLLAYELYSGARPFADLDGLAAVEARARSTVPPLGERRHYFPKDLQDIVMTLLAREPERRFATARAFRKAFESYLRKAKAGPVELVEAAAVTSKKWVRPRKPRRQLKEAPVVFAAPRPPDEVEPPRFRLPTIPPAILELTTACILFVLSGLLVVTAPPVRTDAPPRLVVLTEAKP